MRSRLAWLLGAAALAAAALYRIATRRRRSVPAAEPGVESRAEELRRKLADSRALADERERFESGETPVDEAAPTPDSVDEKRRRVHEHGRAVADEMRRPRSET